MSGGAWDCYPEFAEDEEIMQHIDTLRLMAHYCKDNGKTLAAHELEGFINVLVGCKQKIHDKFERMKDLIHSIDYVAAGDSAWSEVDEAVGKISKDAILGQDTNCVNGEESV